MPSVWPSGAERATKSVPSTVLAPGLYSTTTGWRKFFCSSTSIMRARMSTPPPATLGTMSFTGLVAQGVWARTAPVAAAAAAHPAASRCLLRIMGLSPSGYG